MSYVDVPIVVETDTSFGSLGSFQDGDLRYNRRMTSDSSSYVPFSQRTGLEPSPPQLKLGEVSPELRRLLDYYISLEIGRESHAPYSSRVFKDKWRRIAMDLHVLFLKQPVDTFDYSVSANKERLNAIIQRANIRF